MINLPFEVPNRITRKVFLRTRTMIFQSTKDGVLEKKIGENMVFSMYYLSENMLVSLMLYVVNLDIFRYDFYAFAKIGYKALVRR